MLAVKCTQISSVLRRFWCFHITSKERKKERTVKEREWKEKNEKEEANAASSKQEMCNNVNVTASLRVQHLSASEQKLHVCPVNQSVSSEPNQNCLKFKMYLIWIVVKVLLELWSCQITDEKQKTISQLLEMAS